MSKYTVKDNLKLKVDAHNFKDGESIKVRLTLLDENKKELGKKEDKAKVQNKKANYPFITEDIAKSLSVKPEDVIYVKGWMDSDGDDKIGYNEAVLINFIEEEVLITVIVELPHSKETGWGAKGLAGHTAMAVGDSFFDYGPDYGERGKKFIVNEKEYNIDFNNDGDKLDEKVDLTGKVDFYFAPGRPWWGEVLAEFLSKHPSEVTLNDALKLIINFPWEKTQIYGTVYKIEFYVKKSQANKMIEWWEDRYKHLKAYSVKPWTGEQCTTTVKEALAYGGIDDIDWNTLTPNDILEDLKTEIKSTSHQHKDKKAKVTLIKKEAKSWKPLN